MPNEVMMSAPRRSRRGRPPGRTKHRPTLTEAQARALRAMKSGGSLHGISWTTARALRALGLCELGPGRHGRLTGRGLDALSALDTGEPAEASSPPGDGAEPDAG